jgi:hypothetical protein
VVRSGPLFRAGGVAAWCIFAAVASSPSAALADQVPANFLGTWSRNCADSAAPQVVLNPTSVTIVTDGQRHTYSGVLVNGVLVGGAKATGGQVWLLISQAPNELADFTIEVTPKKQFLILEEGAQGRGGDVRRLFGPKFSRCPGGIKAGMDKTADVATPVAPARRAPGSRWEYVLTDYPGRPRRVLVTGPALGGQEAPHIHFWCQVNSRTAELTLDPSKYDPNSSEGEGFRFLLEIRSASGNAQTFPIVAYSTGPDGGSQFYSRDFLSTPLMDAFGQEGGVLKWRTDKGAEIASWPLSGSTDARAMVRKNCGV